MSDITNTASDLFGLLKSRMQDLGVRDQNGKETSDPEQMRIFTFTYHDQSRDYGEVTVSIVDPRAFKVLFSESMLDELSPAALKNWYNFVRQLKTFAKSHMMTFDIRDITRDQLSLRAIKTHSKINKPQDITSMTESAWTGTSRSSYQKRGPVTIVIRHAAPVNTQVPGARSRNIERIYLQNADGERFKLNFCHLPGARAMANHVRQGGSVFDDLAKYISESVAEMKDLARFVRYVKRNEFSDNHTQELAAAARDRYAGLRRDLLELTSVRRYAEARDRCMKTIKLLGEINKPSSDKISELKTRFSRVVFDEKLESALPRVYAAYEQRQKTPLELTEFLERTDLPLGLSQDDVANATWKVQKYSNSRDWASRCLEDLALRLTDSRYVKISEFASVWSKKILETAESPELVQERDLAVKLTARYLSELKNICADTEYADVAQTTQPVTEDIADLTDVRVLKRFKRKLSEPIPLGHNANNAVLAIQDFIRADDLRDRLISMSREDLESDLTGPGIDARPTIADWMRDNMPGIYKKLDVDALLSQNSEPASASEPAPEPAPAPAPEPAPSVKESDEIDQIKRLSGLLK